VVTYGVSQDDVFCALNAFSKSRRDNPLPGSAMIAMNPDTIGTGTYKNTYGEIVKIDPKTLDQDTEVMRF